MADEVCCGPLLQLGMGGEEAGQVAQAGEGVHLLQKLGEGRGKKKQQKRVWNLPMEEEGGSHGAWMVYDLLVLGEGGVGRQEAEASLQEWAVKRAGCY